MSDNLHPDSYYLTQAVEAIGRMPLLELHRVRRRYDVDIMDMIPTGAGYESELFYLVALVQLQAEAGGRRDYEAAEQLTREQANAAIVALIDARPYVDPDDAGAADKS